MQLLAVKKPQNPAYIRNQTDNTLVSTTWTGSKKMKTIFWGMFGNISDNGCGVIAAFNALVSKNPSTDFIKVRDGLANYGGVLLGIGSIGVDPVNLTFYMKSKFNDANLNFDILGINLLSKKNTENTKKADAIIVLVKWKDTAEMHYFTGIRNKGTDGFNFYNSDIMDVTDNNPITMEQLSEKIKDMGAKPLGLITIND